MGEVWREAVVWSCLNGQPNALGAAVLTVLHRLRHTAGRRAAEGVMQAADKVVPILCGQRHEGAAHEDEFHLVHGVAEPPQLLHAASGLHIGVVSRANGAHGGRLVACVALCGVFKVGVGSAWAVDADVAGGGDVGAAVRLGHDGDDGDATGCAHGLGSQPACVFCGWCVWEEYGTRAPWEEDGTVLLWDGSDDLHKLDAVAHLVAAHSLAKAMLNDVLVGSPINRAPAF